MLISGKQPGDTKGSSFCWDTAIHIRYDIVPVRRSRSDHSEISAN